MYRVAILMIILLLACAVGANERVEWVNEAGTGHFLLRSADGWEPALLLDTEVDIEVNGPVAEVTVTQRFSSRDRAFSEGVYVYPLADNAALHDMEMIVGQRRIQGEVHERREAGRIYDQAKQQGKRTGLVEQQKPNVFTTSVANIAPGETVAVELRYTQALERVGHRFSLHLPLTITPRYIPAGPEQYHALDAGANAAPNSIARTARHTARLPDQAQRVRIQARIDPGLPTTDLVSSSHDIRTNRIDDHYRLTLADGAVPMNKDFRLSWKLAPRADTQATFLTRTLDDQHYGLLMMIPPKPGPRRHVVAREQILVLDRSGSMSGERMKQARRSTQHALRQLDPDDRFNVVAFNDTTRSLFPEPVRATRAHVRRALGFVDGLDGDGGTEMLPALRTALAMKRDPELVRQVIFVTDGAIGNENAVLQMVHEQLDGARLFPVAIGDAPNQSLLRRLARFGRGTSTTIQNHQEVSGKMNRLLERIARPVLSDLHLQLPPDIEAEFSPERIPDLYLGEPLVVSARLSRIPESITVHGRNPQTWQRTLQPETEREHEGVARLWARDRIRALMDRMAQGADEEEIRPRVVDIALRHRLVSRFTSFVAVEKRRVRSEGESLNREQLQSRLPEDMQTRGRGFPDTALNTGLKLRLAAMLALLGGLVLVLAGRRRHAV